MIKKQPILESRVANITVLQREDLGRVRRHLPSAERTFLRAYEGSRPAAVKAKCLDCCNLDKSEVALCSIEGCPLWRFRPYQTKKGRA